jgi:hypothetical protein
VRSLAPDSVNWPKTSSRGIRRCPPPLAEAEDVLKKAREEQERERKIRGGRPRTEQRVAVMSGIIISTVTALALALVLVVCAISSLLVPGGLVSRNLGLAAVTRAGREISVTLDPPACWSPGCQRLSGRVSGVLAESAGFVPAPPRPITAALFTVGVLAIRLVWTVARRTRGPHDLLTGTWVVPR